MLTNHTIYDGGDDMTYPDFIICPKCRSKWDTRIGRAPDCFQKGICPKCGWHLKEEYKEEKR